MKAFMIAMVALMSFAAVFALEERPDVPLEAKPQMQPEDQAELAVEGQTRGKRTLGLLLGGAILGAKAFGAGAVAGALGASAFQGRSYGSGRYYGGYGGNYGNYWGYGGNYANNWGYNNYYNEYPRSYRTYPARAYVIEAWRK